MNKIFKVIFNRATGKLVVVSELTKSNGKAASQTDERSQPSGSSLLNVSLAGAVMLGSVLAPINSAYAGQSSLGGTAANGVSNLAIGTGAVAGIGAADGATAIGTNSNASGSNAVAVGIQAKATALNATAIGINAQAGADAVAIGSQANASVGSQSVAIGSTVNVTSMQATGIGNNVNVSGYAGIAIGSDDLAERATDIKETVQGIPGIRAQFDPNQGGRLWRGTSAGGRASIAIGAQTLASQDWTTALGSRAEATQEAATAIGALAKATGNASFAGGLNATASNNFTTAVGANATASGNTASAYGYNATSSGLNSVAIGKDAGATSSNSTTVGMNATASGEAASAYGYNATSGGANSVAVGKDATASGTNSTVLGVGAAASAGDSIAIGRGATSSNSDVGSIAIGKNAVANGKGAAAFGTSANVTSVYGMAIGDVAQVQADRGLAIGVESRVYGNTSTNAMAIGGGANANATRAIAVGNGTKANGNTSTVIGSGSIGNSANSTILGYNATDVAGQDGAVILGAHSRGSGSAGNEVTNTTQATVNNITYTGFAGTVNGTGKFVSVGDRVAGSQRKIINVAAGEVSSTSTEAINGSQLYAVASQIGQNKAVVKAGANTTVSTATNSSTGGTDYTVDISDATKQDITNVKNSVANLEATKTKYFSVNATATENADNAGAKATNAIAIGPNASSAGQQSIAIGFGSNATTGANAIAIGRLANATGDSGTAVGNSATSAKDAAAFGVLACATQERAIAIGPVAKALGNGAVAVGNNTNASTSNAIAIGNSARALENHTTAIGRNALAQSENGTVIGSGAQLTAGKNEAVVLGSNSRDTGSHAIANVTEATVNGLTYSGFAGTMSTDGRFVSVGTNATGGQRKLINVAAGNISATSTEAINGSQLYATNNVLGNVANSTKNVLGGNAAVAPNGTITMSNVGGTGKNNVNDAIAASRENVVNATNSPVSVSSSTDAATGAKTFTVDLTQQTKDDIAAGKAAAADAADAKATAEQAKNTADAIDGKATQAQADAAAAKATAEQAKNTADAIDGKATQAQADAADAKATAEQAKNTADAIDGKATQAQADAAAAKADATDAKATATDAKTAADAATAAVATKADASRAYKFKVANGETATNTSGDAKEWTLGADDEITFAATSDLNVTTDAAGKIVYGLADTVKSDIAKAKSDAANATTALGLPADGSAPTLTKADAGDLATAPTNLVQAVNDVTAAVNKGISIQGNDASAINKELGQTFDIVGTLDAAEDASSKNIRTANKNGQLEILMATKPEFKEVKVTDGTNTTTISPNGTTVAAGGKEATYGADGIGLKGADGNTTTIGTDDNGNLTVTNGKDGADAKPQTLVTSDNLANMKGSDGKDGKDGTDATSAGAQGLTGKDGLNGASLDDKINALRNGEAGPVVYTDAAGNRLEKANDGKYYPADQVNADGTTVADATPVADPISSVVNPDGSTTSPTTMGNVKSTVGNDTGEGAITETAAKEAISGKDGQPGLLTQTTGLNNAATVGDLQAIAQAGLDFTGDNNATTVHRPLSTKLTVEGEGTWDGANSATDNLYVEADSTNNKLVVKMNSNLTNLSSVQAKDANGNTTTLTPNGTTVAAGGKEATYGVDGIGLKGADGTTTTLGRDADGDLTVTNGKDGANAQPEKIATAGDVAKAVQDAANATTAVAGTGADGKDGKDGVDATGAPVADSAGAKGLSGADGLNGQDLTAKVNALRNGEAGPVVYTDADGNRLEKANDGKYYPVDQVNPDGTLVDANTATPVADPIASVVNPDGTTTKPTTVGNIKSTVGNDAGEGAITEAAAKEAVAGADGKSGLLTQTTGLNNAATVGDLQALAQAGLDFTGDNNATTVHRPLGTKLTVEGEGAWDGANSATDNLYVEADSTNNKLVVKMNSNLTNLSSVQAKDANGNTTTLTPNGTTVAAGGKEATYGVDGIGLKGADGTTTTLGRDADGNLTVTNGKDGADAKPQTLVTSDNLANMKGTDGKDGKDGKDATSAGAQGLTGKDGLNGASLDDKINALRNGEAGSVVYTDADGNRLEKANDGKYYPADQVNPDGSLVDANTATPVADPIASVVNPDGTTTKPTTMGNIKSTVGNDAGEGAITEAAAKEAVAGADGKSGLLTQTTGLNNVATVGDLQAIAQAGLDFTGNNNATTVHRPLGTKLTVEGEGAWNGANSATDNLYVEADSTNNKLVVKMNSNLTNLSSVQAKDANGNTTTLTPTGTTVKAADGKEATYGVDGIGLKGADGNTTTIGKDADGNLTVTNGKDGADAKPQTLVTSDNLANMKGTDGKDGKDGKDATSAGAKGLTGKDGLNGASLDDKINALRNGEAGPVVYTDAAGNRLEKANDGKYYPADQVDADGNPAAGATAVDSPIASVVNPDGSTTDPVKLGNVANATTTYGDNGDLVKVGDVYYNKADLINGQPKADAVAVPAAKAGIANLDAAAPNTALTVADAKNLGWVLSTPNNNYNEAVNNADQVNFVGTGGVNVSGKTNATTGAYEVEVALSEAGKLKLAEMKAAAGESTLSTDAGKVNVETNPAGFVGAQNIADMINGAGWKTNSTTATGGATDTLISAGDVVNFEAGKNIKVTQEVNATTGAVSYTYATADKVSFDEITLGDAANGTTTITNAGTVVTDKDGNKATYGADGSIVTDKDGNEAAYGASGVEVADKDGNVANYGAAGATITDGAGNSTTVAPTGTTVTDGTNTATYGADGIGLKGADGTTTTIGRDKDGNLTVTNGKDGADAKPQTLVTSDNLANMTGTDGKDGKDGKDATSAGAQGLTGKDGLNGASLDDKINALRNGEAGPVVYTDADGNRLVKANDGKYYPAAQVNADGTTATGATPVASPIASIANPDGSTTAPTTLGNVNSTIGLNGKDAQGANQGPIKADAAKTAVAGADGKSGLLAASGPALNNAATVGDLQALVQAGLDFTGNNSATTVHRPLGTKLSVEGEGTWDGKGSASNNLYVEADATNNKLVAKLNSNLTGLSSVEVKDAAGNSTTIKPTGTTVTDGTNTATYDANGLTVKDANGNNAITLVSDATGPSLNFATDANGNGTGKITGVAAGDITPNSSDVVTGAQLYQLTGGNTIVNNPNGTTTSTAKGLDGKTIMTTDENGNQVEKQYTLTTYNVEGQTEFVTNSVITAVHNMNEQGIKFFHTNDGVAEPINQASNGIDSSASGSYATAVGYQAKADGTNAIAMGKGATVTEAGENSIAIGTGNQVAASKSVAFGNDNVITSSNTFVLGNDVNNSGNVNGKPVAMGNTVENSVYLGNKTTATAGDGSRTGTLKNRKQDGTEGTTTTAGSTGTVSSVKVGNMTYGNFAGAKANGVVSVGAAGNERRVQNVAAGEISATSTDAINGSQLYSVAQGVDKLDGKVNRMNRKLRSGIAAATAMTNIPQVTMPGKSALGAGVGSYDGQGALAVGYSRMSDSGRVIFKVSAGATTQGKYNAGAGVALQW